MNGGIDQSIGPGIGGFLAFFLLAVALWFLMRNMSTRLRNVTFEEEAAEERAAAQDADFRPRRRQIFLPVRDDAGATGDATVPSARGAGSPSGSGIRDTP